MMKRMHQALNRCPEHPIHTEPHRGAIEFFTSVGLPFATGGPINPKTPIFVGEGVEHFVPHGRLPGLPRPADRETLLETIRRGREAQDEWDRIEAETEALKVVVNVMVNWKEPTDE